jgi:hypothetical protein
VKERGEEEGTYLYDVWGSACMGGKLYQKSQVFNQTGFQTIFHSSFLKVTVHSNFSKSYSSTKHTLRLMAKKFIYLFENPDNNFHEWTGVNWWAKQARTLEAKLLESGESARYERFFSFTDIWIQMSSPYFI